MSTPLRRRTMGHANESSHYNKGGDYDKHADSKKWGKDHNAHSGAN